MKHNTGAFFQSLGNSTVFAAFKKEKNNKVLYFQSEDWRKREAYLSEGFTSASVSVIRIR